jgi:hypothetical protein
MIGGALGRAGAAVGVVAEDPIMTSTCSNRVRIPDAAAAAEPSIEDPVKEKWIRLSSVLHAADHA